jgi:hypothetical protein
MAVLAEITIIRLANPYTSDIEKYYIAGGKV